MTVARVARGARGSLVRHPRPSNRVFGRDFDQLMDDLWGGFKLAPVAFAPQTPQPSFDAVEFEDEYRVTADLPGVEPVDLEVSVEDGVLTIRGHRHFFDESASAGEKEGDGQEGRGGEGGGVTRVDERGRFERRIRFPGDIVEDDVKATYKNGVLTVTIPKPEEVKPEVRAIPIETA